MTPLRSRPGTRSRSLEPALVALSVVRPINHFSGLQTFYPTLSSGKGAAPFATLADYDNALKRHDGFVALPRSPRSRGFAKGERRAWSTPS